ncbi:MAG: hypothetical protein NVSMB12_01240 [Acidimicrobiales bacterium]
MDGGSPLNRGIRFGGDDSAALAANWKTLLLVDGALGVAAIVVGSVLVLAGHIWGAAPVALGLAYGFFVGGRAARWMRLRKQAGL